MAVKCFLFVLSLVALAGIYGQACVGDSGHGVTYVNKSDQAIALYIYGVKDFDLGASSQKTYSLLTLNKPALFEAKASDGTTLFSKELSWQDLGDMSWTIVIQ